MRKFIILIIMVNAFTSITNAQEYIRMNINQPALLTAKAGNDTLVCKNHRVQLGGIPSATGGNSHYVYLWSPTTGMDDPTAANPTVVPTQTISYSLTVTDKSGCQAVSYVTIYVDQCMGIHSQQLSQTINVFPNPSNGVFTISGLGSQDNQLQRIEVFNEVGQTLLSQEYNAANRVSELRLDTKINEPGIYFMKITMADQVVSKRLIIK